MPLSEGFAASRYSTYVLGAARILAGALFFQHGGEKLWGFAGARVDHNFGTLRAWGGPIEVIGGILIALGFRTRIVAFILCGEMAVAYFKTWAPRGFFPIQNGGEEAVQLCYFYLWLVTVGAGAWSIDRWLRENSSALTRKLTSWEGRSRSLLRIIFGFLFLLHGVRIAFNALPALAGRRLASPMPLDQLPLFMGYAEILAGALLMVGALTTWVALLCAITAIAAYLHSIAAAIVWPVRGGGNETLLYAVVFACLWARGGGEWGFDAFMERWRRSAKLTSAVSD